MLPLIQASQLNQDQIWSLYQEVISDLNRKKIFQWNEQYPTAHYIRDAIRQRQCWIYTKDRDLISCVVLNQWQDPQWKEISWKLNQAKILVVHALVIKPLFQNQGIGQEMMITIEDLALKHGYTGIRLDAFSQNHQADALYQKLGYHYRGTVHLTYKPSGYQNYKCYEKAIIT